MNVTGRVTSVLILENRPDLFILHVNAGVMTGHYNCRLEGVTLDNERPSRAGKIGEFLEARHVRCECVDPDFDTAGTGSIVCKSIALSTVQE